LSGWLQRLITVFVGGGVGVGGAIAGQAGQPPYTYVIPPVNQQISNAAAENRPPPSQPDNSSQAVFAEIVKEVFDELVKESIKGCYIAVAHFALAAFYSLRKKVGKSASADQGAYAQLNNLIGDDRAWLRGEMSIAALDDEDPITQEQLQAHVRQVSSAEWEAAGARILGNAKKSLLVHLLGKESPIEGGVEAASNFFAERTRQALFSGAIDETLFYLGGSESRSPSKAWGVF
jgi:hypothetical protein